MNAQEYLGNDLAFFQKKTRLYQKWLESKGLGEAIKADEIKLEKNGLELELLLSLKTTDPDSAAAIWTGLRSGFAAGNPGHKLEETLFEAFIRMMEIPAAQGNLQVYFPNRDGAGYNPCFYIWIWEENGKVQVEDRTNNCKAQSLEIVVRLPQPAQVSNSRSITVPQRDNAAVVFENILTYARNRYEPVRCDNRTPRVQEVDQDDYTLKFAVNDLCREVLTDETQSLWCDFVELWWGPCNDMRRERLEFTFNYVPTAEGYVLTGTLTGKFGSGVYRPRISGYMDMEPDFEDDFLKPYVIDFQNDLRKYLE